MSMFADHGGKVSVAPPAFSVLLVDDESAILQQLAEGLTSFGLQVGQAGDVEEALARLAADPGIAVVVTDVRMPGRDGMDLAQEILAQHDEARAVEIIFITGHALEDAVPEPLRAGAAGFLRKPFRLSLAANVISAALARATARRQAAG